MQIGSPSSFHLTYSTKIHPGNGWGDLFQALQACVPALKAKLAPRQAFGLGLRLSDRESRELLDRGALSRFREFLDAHDLYVFTLNGFPFGPFSGELVKAGVFAPDWREESRVAYTLRLVEILQELLPPGLAGGISTLPLSYKPWVSSGDAEAWARLTRNLARVAARLAQVRTDHGVMIHLDLEPEPDGLLEHSREVVRFFHDWLLPQGAPWLAAALGLSRDRARQLLLEHIQVCLDTCHMAVEYEDPAQALEVLSQNGISVGKVQLTSALKVRLPPESPDRIELARQLQVFAQSPYLHQVIAVDEAGARRQYRDLADALPHLQASPEKEWRIHFHVPLFVDRYKMVSSTRDDTRLVLRLLQERGFSHHLEIETYTWNLLPPGLKEGVRESLEREYRWVLETFTAAAAPG